MTIPVFLHQPPFLGLSPLSSKKFRTPPPSDSIFGRSYRTLITEEKGGGGGGCSNYVSIVNTCSDEASIICGVPQFSTLGPLLFLICISHMPKAVDSELLYFMPMILASFSNIKMGYSRKNLNGRGVEDILF